MIPMLAALQNLCDDRSGVHFIHSALILGGHFGGGSKVDCEDCVFETTQGSAAFHVSLFWSPVTYLLDACH
jgi:hypothetical protein